MCNTLFQVTSPDWQFAVQHAVQQYVRYVIPARPYIHDTVDAGDGISIIRDDYSHYNLWPPPVGIFIISIIEVGYSLQQ
jgi:hypothetical protein